ncbi:hypothetical protein ACEPAF_2065 [Sanghuangporus sanghuang]
MSISDRLRRSSSIDEPLGVSNVNAVDNGDARVVTGVALSCDDMSSEGDIHREYKLIRGVHQAVDFFRTSNASRSGRIYIAAGGAARAAFSSPVMSRRHARITFAVDGSVTVMDLGSMHGTYLGGVDFDGLLPEKLKPRRHYTLRAGDTILLGKPVNRDERDWKPVAIRVTFLYDTGARPTTPPPNRYGLFIESAGASDTEDDAYSISSSGDDEDEDDARSQTRTSPANSPVVSHVPLQFDGMISTSASRESLIVGSRIADDVEPASGVFDLNRTLTATAALRSILPPIPSIRSAILRLPSLRELGIFSNTSPSSCSGTSEYKVAVDEDVQVVDADCRNGTDEANMLAPTPVGPEPLSTSQGSPAIAESSAEEDGASCSMFPWQEPSHPQNQLGLELSELDGFTTELHDEARNEIQLCNAADSSSNVLAPESGSAEHSVKAKAAEEDDVKSMDISPTTSRAASPAFRASGVIDGFGHDNGLQSAPQGEQYCRCHEGEDEEFQEGEQQDNGAFQHYDSQQDVEVQASPLPSMPVTPDNKRSMDGLTTPSASDVHSERRRAKMARLELAYGPIPSPVSIGRRTKRSGARLGPTLMSPTPNPPGPFGRSGRSHVDKYVDARHTPTVGALRARVRSLETRMKEIQGSALMAASMATASASASSSASAASIDEARKEMESMREEMRRLSGLMEALVARMDVREIDPHHTECGVQAAEPSREPINDRSETSSQMSGKRKRTDDLCTLGMDDLECIGLAEGLDLQFRRAAAKEGIRSFHETSLRPDVRPAKRLRTGYDARKSKAVMTVAAAAGYTSLGAALTWITLAYVL